MKLENYVNAMKEKINHYNSVPVNTLKVCVTAGNEKIGKVLNVSLPPVFTCPNCSGCKHECYDKDDCRYKNVLDARARNYSIMTRDIDGYFAQIQDAVAKHPSFTFFRFHVGGDIPFSNGDDYFSRMVQFAKNNPSLTIWTYTKNYWTVNRYVKENGGSIKAAIPENFSVMFSQWRGIPMENPYGFAEFQAYYDDETIPDNVMVCPGNCRICEEKKIGCPYRQTVCTRIRKQGNR